MKLYRLNIFLLICFCANCSPSNKHKNAINEIRIFPRSAWNAMEPQPYKLHMPQRITVHHEGTTLDIKDDAKKKINAIQKWGMGPDRKWADIPYHFLIAPNGDIFEGRAVNTVGETATEYDPTGHLLITCLGNFEKQEVPKRQLKSLLKLIAYCSDKYGISPSSLSTHRDNSSQTTCPGKNLYKYFQNGYVMKRVEMLLR